MTIYDKPIPGYDPVITSISRNNYSLTVPPFHPIEETPGLETLLNSYGYRSDEFSTDEASENYLFTGCSFTWGAGLPEGKSWSHIVSKRLNGSKHFSLAMSGQSVSAIVTNIYISIFVNSVNQKLFLHFSLILKDLKFLTLSLKVIIKMLRLDT